MCGLREEDVSLIHREAHGPPEEAATNRGTLVSLQGVLPGDGQARAVLCSSVTGDDRCGPVGAGDSRYRPVHDLRVGEGDVDRPGEGCCGVRRVLGEGGEERLNKSYFPGS